MQPRKKAKPKLNLKFEVLFANLVRGFRNVTYVVCVTHTHACDKSDVRYTYVCVQSGGGVDEF